MGRNEDAIVEKIRALFPRYEGPLGIGDDAAILDAPSRLVVTTDVLVEDVDFTRDIPARFVAVKSLAANLSDVAAMGARPTEFLLTLAIPQWFHAELDDFLSSLAAEATRYRVQLVGGDLSSSGLLTIGITAFGAFDEGARPLLRSAARRGDRIFVSRPLGASHAGLTLLRHGWKIDSRKGVAPPEGMREAFGYAHREFAAAAISRHVAPEAEVELGRKLAALPQIHSCIDVSDGLSTDLHRLCRASEVGAVVEAERLPVFADLGSVARSLGIDPGAAVLHGGEEYALLFTGDARESELSRLLGRPVFAIGRITESGGVQIERDGVVSPLEPAGFDHFTGSS